MEIVRGIYQLKVPIPDNPLGCLNAYVIDGGDGLALVDTGFNVPEALESLLSQLREHGFVPSDIRKLIITHWHPDHYGLAREVKKRSGARLLVHRAEVEFLRDLLHRYPEFRRQTMEWLLENGMPLEEIEQLRPANEGFFGLDDETQVDQILEGGETISVGRVELEVISTPGHSPGHICLYERERRILLSGDHVLPIITPNISMRTKSDQHQLSHFLDSLQRLRHLEVDLVLPAHEHIFYSLGDRLEQIKQHHEERCRAIADAGGNGWSTGYEIASKIPWMEGQMPWATMPVFHRRWALTETLAHLHFLSARGAVRQSERDGLARWKTVRN
ncbi:MAG: MBL fold metallo-hydrolase [Chloroflexi bacterium]|nr:MBL fold metallo-hydrolase [Chloroflexota bacterium]